MTNPVIHIGLHKTATTSLQHILFGKHSDLEAIGLPNSRHDPQLLQFRNCLFGATDSEFDTQLEVFSSVIQQKAGGRTIVFSEENLSTGELRSPPLSNPPYGNVTYPYFADGITVSRAQLADRLAKLFPNATVLVVIREQLSYLKSYFLQMQKTGRLVEDFDSWLCDQFELPKAPEFIDMLDYQKLISIWRDAFPQGRIKVVCYETLLREPDTFYRDIATVLGLRPEDVSAAMTTEVKNTRVSNFEIFLRPIVAKIPGAWSILRLPLIRTVARMVRSRLPKQSATIDSDIQKRLIEMFALQNSIVATECDLPLLKLGYHCR